MFKRISIKPDRYFWLNAIDYFYSLNLEHISITDILIIVPTANHIHICEQAWIAYYKQQQTQNKTAYICDTYALPKIQTLKHVIEQYNVKYEALNHYQEHLDLYQFCKQELKQNRFSSLKHYTPLQLWQFTKQCVHICHELSDVYLAKHFNNKNIDIDIQVYAENVQKHLNTYYQNLSLKIVDVEAQILLAIWKYSLNIAHQPFHTWRLCQNFAALTSQTILYLAFDKQDSNLQQIAHIFQQHNKLHQLYVIDIDIHATNELENIQFLHLFPEIHANKYTDNLKNKNTTKSVLDYSVDYALYTRTYFGKQRIVECNDLEETSNYILHAITQAILQGHKNLALIAQDRIAIRRIKALLQVHYIPLVDETGWKFVSTLLATCIKEWLDMVAIQQINMPWMQQHLAIYFTDTNIDKASVQHTLTQHLKIWQIQHTLPQWLDIWYAWCKYLNLDTMEHTLNSLCEHINELCSSDSENIYSFQEWSFLLQDILEQGNVADLYAHSTYKVHILALNGARLRTFDALWFIGCDDAQLPSHSQHALFLNEYICQNLGLETRAQRFQQQCIDFLSLMYMHINVSKVEFIYQAYHAQNKHVILSRFLQKLHYFAAMPYVFARDILNKITKQQQPISSSLITSTLSKTPKFPSIEQNRITHLSTYDVMDLYICPYRFYLKKIAGLSAPYTKNISQAKQYGSWVHDILHQTHKQQAQKIPAIQKISLEDTLYQCTEKILSEQILDAPAHEFKQQWLQQIPIYNVWQLNNQLTWQEGESQFAIDIPIGSSQIKLSARIDRIDSQLNAHTNIKDIHIIDYKWNTKKRMDSTKNTQLLMYYHIYCSNQFNHIALPNVDVAFLPLKDTTKIELYYPYADKDNTSTNISDQAYDFMQELTIKLHEYQENQAVFEATPSSKECQYCDYRYMCVYKNQDDIEQQDIED
jgi:ATP-dependent helicase/nuclease subunit B